mgnify:CR=1 FL=1
MTQKQLSRFMLDLDEWDNEDKRIFDISAGNPITPEGDNTYVFTSFKLSKSQYSELLNEIQSYNQGSDGNATQFEIQEDPFVLMCELDDIHVQLFFENKNEILEFQNFLLDNYLSNK